MAGVAGVWDAELFSQLRPDKREGMAAYKLAFDGDLDFWHVTRRALATSALLRVMRVLSD